MAASGSGHPVDGRGTRSTRGGFYVLPPGSDHPAAASDALQAHRTTSAPIALPENGTRHCFSANVTRREQAVAAAQLGDTRFD